MMWCAFLALLATANAESASYSFVLASDGKSWPVTGNKLSVVKNDGVEALMGEEDEGKDGVGLHCNISSWRVGQFPVIEGITEGEDVPTGKCFVWASIRSPKDVMDRQAVFSTSSGSVTFSAEADGKMSAAIDVTSKHYSLRAQGDVGTIKGQVFGLTSPEAAVLV
eukprot:TRINITY_DN31423_c0_g1_i1.p1 TRINITY_DN31423_c0_g1~~TRINITY_DN31423_c0_g1_i1.p1  ORF type:complete len:166 (-),score=28.43 TRINITY_DN31423_c0_g1_i1:92-589(-)